MSYSSDYIPCLHYARLCLRTSQVFLHRRSEICSSNSSSAYLVSYLPQLVLKRPSSLLASRLWLCAWLVIRWRPHYCMTILLLRFDERGIRWNLHCTIGLVSLLYCGSACPSEEFLLEHHMHHVMERRMVSMLGNWAIVDSLGEFKLLTWVFFGKTSDIIWLN